MSTSNRIAGKKGLNAPWPIWAPDDLRLVHSYLPPVSPAPQYPIDVSGNVANWGMLGNGPDPSCTIEPNGVGDCTFAGRQHYRMAKAACHGKTNIMWETSDQLVKEYLSYDHGKDVGAVLSHVLLAWYKAGIILAFAPVDHTRKAAVDSAMQAFNGCLVGVNLTPDVEQRFVEGQEWILNQEPDPLEKHCIVKVKSTQDSDTWVTWGAEQQSTAEWTAACIVEAWVIISEEDVDATGINIDQLRADIDALEDRRPRPWGSKQ